MATRLGLDVGRVERAKPAERLGEAKPVAPRAGPGPEPWTPKSVPHLPLVQDSFAKGRAQALKDMVGFYNQVHGVELHHEVPFGNGAVASAAWARLPTGTKVVLRFVKDPAVPVAVNNATHILNRQLGGSLHTFPSAVPETKRAVMYMAHAPEGFVAGNKASPEWLARVPEAARVSAALLDFLTAQQDRLPKNVMVNEKGEVALIDPDFSWGIANPWTDHPSAFFPKRPLAYQGSQASQRDLPPQARAVLRQICSSTPEVLAETYGVSRQAAVEFKERAQAVHDRGLTGAISEWRARKVGTLTPDTFRTHSRFERTGDAVSARVGKAKPEHLVFGPYRSYPTGKLDVTFRLKLEGSLAPKPSAFPAVGKPVATAPDIHRWGPGWVQDFEGGTFGPCVVMRRDGQAASFVVRGLIRVAYFKAGGGPGGLGFPLEDEHPSPTGAFQRFERGHITWDAKKEAFLPIKDANPASPVVATLDVYDRGKVIAKRDVLESELTRGEWTSVRLGANLPMDTQKLEFRVYWHGRHNLDAGPISTQ